MTNTNKKSGLIAPGVDPGFPAPVTLEPVILSFWQRCTWFLSRFGRARHCLSRASLQLESADSRAALVDTFTKLRTSDIATDIRLATIVRDILLFLASTAIRGASRDDACRWLQELDTLFPDLPTRISLRWQFLEELKLRRDFSAYSEQAKLFFGDQLFLPEEHFAAMRSLLRGLFEEAGRALCEEVLESAPPDVQACEPFRSTLALCRCPKLFQSRDEATEWEKEIVPESLTFSPAMAAEAALIAARVAEWAGNWEALATAAREATVLTPADFSGRYWLLRAYLHGAALGASETAVPANTPNSPAWNRLCRLLNLHTARTPSHARAAVMILSGELDPPDILERDLVLQLLERALTDQTFRSPSILAECADLSATLSRLAGSLPWIEVNLALKEILLDGKHSAAANRLAQVTTPEAKELFRLARILAGAPSSVGVFLPDDCLSTVEWTLQRITGRSPCSPLCPTDTTLLEALQGAHASDLAQRFPVLRAVINVLQSTVATLKGSGGASVDLKAAIPSHSPAWTLWLIDRIRQLSVTALEGERLLSESSRGDFACAWSLDAWWSYYGPTLPRLPQAIMEVRELLERASIRATRESLRGLQAVLAFRHRTHTVSPSGQPDFSSLSNLLSLGSTFDALIANEMELEIGFVQARSSLKDHQPEIAFREFQRLCAHLDNYPAVTVLWWRPLLSYWLGIAAAKAGLPQAQALLTELVNDRKGVESRAQLALLALQRSDLNSAKSWLATQEPVCPSILYAQALLMERCGEPRKASDLLKTFPARFGVAPPYAAACGRLLAAIAERQFEAAKAIDQNREILREDPSDLIAAARLTRLLLHQAYSVEAIPEPPSIPTVFFSEDAHNGAAISWTASYRLLFRMLASSGGDLSDLHSDVASLSPKKAGYCAWRQFLGRRFLKEHRVSDALGLYTSEDPNPPAVPTWFRFTSAIFRAWHLLNSISHDTDLSSLSERLESSINEITVCADTSSDAVAKRWQFLLSKARILVNLTDDAEPDFAPWNELSPWPFSLVSALWASSSGVRSQAAKLLTPILSTPDSEWTESQRQVLCCLAAWANNDDEDFVANYAKLEESPDSLPVSASALWLAAASVWFRNRNWDRLLERELPACVADLSLPRVRLIIGLAYAQTALEDVTNGDSRAALQRISQARMTLTEGILT